MRVLKEPFLTELQSGFLSGLTRAVASDRDLNLEIRRDYINVYYKGHSLLKLSDSGTRNNYKQYKVQIDKAFANGLEIPKALGDENTTAKFLANVSSLKQKIALHGISLETEYEQMIIRANNIERRNNSDYFVIDRQYVEADGRFDLMGFYWDRHSRGRTRTVPLCLMEVKFALNPDIKNVHKQLAGYYQSIEQKAAEVAEEAETMFRQKLRLGLYHNQAPERVAAMRELHFAREIAAFQFILILVDYNPNSTLFHPEDLAQLPFARQIKVFRTGFAMWKENVETVGHVSRTAPPRS
jgi:hypothetical protein